MLKTFLLNRPFVVFDPSNKDHRRIYRHFLKTGSWKNCDYQFVCEAPYLDLPSCINLKLVEYYMGQEFRYKSKTKTTIKDCKKTVA